MHVHAATTDYELALHRSHKNRLRQYFSRCARARCSNSNYCLNMALSRSVLASVLLTVTALQRPAHRTRSTRLRATTAPDINADVVVVTHAAGRMGASLCAQLHEALTQREK